jgi:hypothetical protein
MRNKHHTITIEELMEARYTADVVLASSSREKKRLVGKLNGNLEIYVNYNLVWIGTQSHTAMEEYNKIEDEYIDPLKKFKL